MIIGTLRETICLMREVPKGDAMDAAIAVKVTDMLGEEVLAVKEV
jgi:hypothetical protein